VRRPGLEPGRAADPRLSALLGSSKAGGPSAARGRVHVAARVVPGPRIVRGAGHLPAAAKGARPAARGRRGARLRAWRARWRVVCSGRWCEATGGRLWGGGLRVRGGPGGSPNRPG